MKNQAGIFVALIMAEQMRLQARIEEAKQFKPKRQQTSRKGSHHKKLIAALKTMGTPVQYESCKARNEAKRVRKARRA